MLIPQHLARLERPVHRWRVACGVIAVLATGVAAAAAESPQQQTPKTHFRVSQAKMDEINKAGFRLSRSVAAGAPVGSVLTWTKWGTSKVETVRKRPATTLNAAMAEYAAKHKKDVAAAAKREAQALLDAVKDYRKRIEGMEQGRIDAGLRKLKIDAVAVELERRENAEPEYDGRLVVGVIKDVETWTPPTVLDWSQDGYLAYPGGYGPALPGTADTYIPPAAELEYIFASASAKKKAVDDLKLELRGTDTRTLKKLALDNSGARTAEPTFTEIPWGIRSLDGSKPQKGVIYRASYEVLQVIDRENLLAMYPHVVPSGRFDRMTFWIRTDTKGLVTDEKRLRRLLWLEGTKTYESRGGSRTVYAFRDVTSESPELSLNERELAALDNELDKLINDAFAKWEAEEKKSQAARPAKSAESDERKERAAASLLRLAKLFLDRGDRENAEKRLKTILEEYPGTKAAEEAKELLE